MQDRTRPFARWGLWALPIWAALLFLSTLTHQPDPQTEFGAFAAYVTTGQFLASHLLGSIVGAAISSVGVVALMLYLLETRVASRAIAGMVATVMGNTLTAAVFGAAAFAQPAAGRLSLAGREDAQEFYNAVYAAPLFATVLVGMLLMLIGGVLAGSAIAGSGRLPRWAGWLYAFASAAFMLLSIPLPAAQTPTSALLLIATVAVAWSATTEGRRLSRPQELPVDA